MSKSITITQLKTEVYRERWDRPSVPYGARVNARDTDGDEYYVTGFHADPDTGALVLTIQAVAADYGDYDIEQPEPDK